MAELIPPNSAPPAVRSQPLLAGASPMAQIGSLVRQPGIARMLPWFAGAAGLGLLVLGWSAFAPAPQRMLYSSLQDGERAEVVAALDGAGIGYHIDPASGAMTVGEDDLYRARMVVASQGALAMPESGTDLLDSLPMGASRTLEGDRLRAAQERELQLTIMEIDGVEAARVHLAKTDKSVFVREASDPTASVMLRLVRGKTLTGEQVLAIANLVAASVPGLAPDRVRIVDQHGRLLSSLDGADNDGLDLQARTEAKLRAQIAQLLTPIVGEHGFSSEVQVELDMAEETSARESYEKEGVVRSETLSESGAGGSERTARGIPGATSNLPPADPSAAERAPKGGMTADAASSAGAADGASNASRTYEVGREVAVTSSGPGRLRRLSVAVAIDAAALPKASRQDVAKLEELIASAAGADPRRGDQVTVVTRKFRPDELEKLGFWEMPWFATVLRHTVALIIVILILVLGVRPVQKMIAKRLSSGRTESGQSQQGADLPANQLASGVSPAADGTGNLREQVELARRISREQPDDALQALRRMLRLGTAAGSGGSA